MQSRGRTAYLLLVPLILLYGLLLGGGLTVIVLESLDYIPVLGRHQFTLNSYQTLLQSRGIWQDTLYSIYLAAGASILSTFLGIMIAYCMLTAKRQSFLKAAALKAMQGGVILPYLYAVFLAMLLLGQSGTVSRVLWQLGVLKGPDSFPELILDSNGIGIIFVYVLKGTPFMALLVYKGMAAISGTYADAAKTLHASNFLVLRKVYIPLSARTIVWASCILFAYALGSFEVPYLLGGMAPAALSARLYSLFIHPDLNRISQAMALSVFLVVLGGSLVTVYALVLKRILGGRLL